MSESRQVAIVVADDHIGVAHALTSLLGRFYATLPAANSIPQLRSLLQEWTGSSQASGAQLVVLLDLEFPGGEDGLEALPDLRRGFPGVRFVVHSAREQQTIVRTAMLEGADGYVAKACGIAELRQAIASAVAGRPKVLLGSGVEPTLGGGLHPERPLTPALRRVLVCLQAGRRRQEIADVLGISLSAVEADVTRLRRAYGVRRGEAIDWGTCQER